MESELARDTVEQLMTAGINFVTYLPETRSELKFFLY